MEPASHSPLERPSWPCLDLDDPEGPDDANKAPMHVAAVVLDQAVKDQASIRPIVGPATGVLTTGDDKRTLYCPKADLRCVRGFKLDHVYRRGCSAADVLAGSIELLVPEMLNGKTCAVLMLGQSARQTLVEGSRDDKHSGLLALTVRSISTKLDGGCDGARGHTVKLSWVQADTRNGDVAGDCLARRVHENCRSQPYTSDVAAGVSMGDNGTVGGMVRQPWMADVRDPADVSRLVELTSTRVSQQETATHHSVMTLSVEHDNAPHGRADIYPQQSQHTGRLHFIVLADLWAPVEGDSAAPGLRPADWLTSLRSMKKSEVTGRSTSGGSFFNTLLTEVLHPSTSAALVCVLDPSLSQALHSLLTLEVAIQLRELHDRGVDQKNPTPPAHASVPSHNFVQRTGESQPQNGEAQAEDSRQRVAHARTSSLRHTCSPNHVTDKPQHDQYSQPQQHTHRTDRPMPPKRPPPQPPQTGAPRREMMSREAWTDSSECEMPRSNQPPSPQRIPPNEVKRVKLPGKPKGTVVTGDAPPCSKCNSMLNEVHAHKSEAASLAQQVSLLRIGNDSLRQERQALEARLTAEGGMLKAKDRERLRSAEQTVKDFEMYKEVMEKTLSKMQAEMDALRADKEDAKKYLQATEKALCRGKSVRLKQGKEVRILLGQHDQLQKERDEAVESLGTLQKRVAVLEKEKREALKTIVETRAAQARHKHEAAMHMSVLEEEVAYLREQLIRNVSGRSTSYTQEVEPLESQAMDQARGDYFEDGLDRPAPFASQSPTAMRRAAPFNDDKVADSHGNCWTPSSTQDDKRGSATGTPVSFTSSILEQLKQKRDACIQASRSGTCRGVEARRPLQPQGDLESDAESNQQRVSAAVDAIRQRAKSMVRVSRLRSQLSR